MSTSARQGQGMQGSSQAYSGSNYAAASTAWSGWVIFAATMMLLVGAFNIVDGFVALFNAGFYGSHYSLITGNLTAWGWWNLIIGGILVVTGLSLFTGSLWARIAGIAFVAINALAQLTFIAVFPIWALVIIGIDVVVIYALAVNREIA
jgi:hypothetical protein